VFGRRPVISAWGLQYRLCETGPTKLDPRLLAASLKKIAESRRSPSRPLPGLFADSTIDKRATTELAAQCVIAATILAEGVGTITSDDLARAFGLTPREDAEDKTNERFGHRRLAGSITIQTHSLIGTLKRPRAVRAWILNDLNWLYPDDARLWRMLRLHAPSGHPLLIVARKIAPVTFHLLKSMGVRGVQFYSLLCATDPSSGVREAADSLVGLGKCESDRMAERLVPNSLRVGKRQGSSSIRH
jgi:hypothetical protein